MWWRVLVALALLSMSCCAHSEYEPNFEHIESLLSGDCPFNQNNPVSPCHNPVCEGTFGSGSGESGESGSGGSISGSGSGGYISGSGSGESNSVPICCAAVEEYCTRHADVACHDPDVLFVLALSCDSLHAFSTENPTTNVLTTRAGTISPVDGSLTIDIVFDAQFAEIDDLVSFEEGLREVLSASGLNPSAVVIKESALGDILVELQFNDESGVQEGNDLLEGDEIEVNGFTARAAQSSDIPTEAATSASDSTQVIALATVGGVVGVVILALVYREMNAKRQGGSDIEHVASSRSASYVLPKPYGASRGPSKRFSQPYMTVRTVGFRRPISFDATTTDLQPRRLSVTLNESMTALSSSMQLVDNPAFDDVVDEEVSSNVRMSVI